MKLMVWCAVFFLLTMNTNKWILRPAKCLVWRRFFSSLIEREKMRLNDDDSIFQANIIVKINETKTVSIRWMLTAWFTHFKCVFGWCYMRVVIWGWFGSVSVYSTTWFFTSLRHLTTLKANHIIMWTTIHRSMKSQAHLYLLEFEPIFFMFVITYRRSDSENPVERVKIFELCVITSKRQRDMDKRKKIGNDLKDENKLLKLFTWMQLRFRDTLFFRLLDGSTDSHIKYTLIFALKLNDTETLLLSWSICRDCSYCCRHCPAITLQGRRLPFFTLILSIENVLTSQQYRY